MNEKTAYEQLIAAKLQALPLPDMADAIWARIEAQLDVDMPPDNNPGGGNAPNFPTGGIAWGGISLIVVAVLYLFFSQTKKTDIPQNLPASTTPVTTQPVTTPANSPPSINMPVNATPAGTSTGPATNGLPTPLLDSNTTTSVAQPLFTDSTVLQEAAPPPTAIAPAKTDTVATVKKGRGVSGITDNDYRIVPKKDSSKNN